MNRLISPARWFAASAVPVLCAALAGCAVGTPRDLVRGPGYRPENVFTGAGALPVNIRRVVMLPLVCDEKNYDLNEGCAELGPILRAELLKTKKFEVICSNADIMKNRTGSADWASEDTLPQGFFSLLRSTSGCDAVLFSRLTVFRAYPPLAIGWRVRLVDAQTRRTIWAADEVFDEGQRSVENGARRHQLTDERDPSGAPDEWFVQNSPAKFGEYTAACLLATLPPR